MSKNLPSTLFLGIMLFILLLGLLLIGLYYYFANYQSLLPLSTFSTPVTSEPVSLNFNLSSPEDNLLTSSSDLLIQGKAALGATVILSLDSGEKILEQNTKGDFSTTIKLKDGLNIFNIFVFDVAGNTKSLSRTIYYSKEKI
ncbi:MAG: hypothetical protein Q7S88_02735 [Candidatus Daviesbacteria bacterium]|nr:hypothetical protein [Candidatus Daviesbacteria bacterium]